MVDTFTPLLRLRKPEVGANNNLWAPPTTGGLNDGFIDMIDQSIAGRADIDVAAGNVTLTKSDGVSDNHRPMFLRATGAPGVARAIIVPDPPTQKMYIVQNQSDANVVMRTVSGTGVTITPEQSVLCYVDSALDDVFAITFLGNAVVRPSAYTTGTLFIQNATAGDTGGITYEFAKQGEFTMFNMREFSATITPGAAFSQINLVSLTPSAVFPADLLPAFQTGIPIDMIVGGVLQRWVFTTGGISTFILYNEDPLVTTAPNGTVCTLPHSLTFTWSDKGFVS